MPPHLIKLCRDFFNDLLADGVPPAVLAEAMIAVACAQERHANTSRGAWAFAARAERSKPIAN